MKPLIITEPALQLLTVAPLTAEWFIRPTPVPDVPFQVTETPNGVYICTAGATPVDRLLVISRSGDGLFEGVPEGERRGVFERCVRLGLHGFDSSVALNPKWMPFHANNKLSIFAYGLGHKERIVAEINARSEGHVYIFGFGDGFLNLGKIKPDYKLYDDAITGFLEVGPTQTSGTGAAPGTFDLAQIEQTSVTKGLSYSDWYPLRLTLDQRRFVDHNLTGPLRLRGAAGTGKTLAMAIKALKLKYDSDAEGAPLKILFVTHSWAMAEYVDRLLSAMDENPSARSTIDVFPLLTLAEARDYSEIGRRPLGIDSDEGKRLALKEIGIVLDDFVQGDWAAYRLSCSVDFVERIDSVAASIDQRLFCWDLLVEFGCVIAAQGILTRSNDRERYMRVKRQRWMMPLDGNAEREAVFTLWVGFMEALKAKGLIPTDQIISDYLNDLSTFYWEAARQEKGYDVLFVDETHLFNSQERLVFHNLLCDGDSPPLVVMALDPNQSPRETFTNVVTDAEGNQGNIFERAKLPKSEKIDLVDVFRYTPQISALISSVGEAAPGLDLVEDWDIPSAASVTDNGALPTYIVADDALQTFRTAIRKAFLLQKAARDRGGRVAILCMDGPRFERFRAAAVGQFKADTFVVTSRDDIEGLRYAGRKIVVSTPEYVAGLQFDTVILVDVNKDKVPEGKYHGFHLRRFLSELYLGLSRAERDLLLIASKDEGGLAPALKAAVTAGLLVEGAAS